TPKSANVGSAVETAGGSLASCCGCRVSSVVVCIPLRTSAHGLDGYGHSTAWEVIPISDTDHLRRECRSRRARAVDVPHITRAATWQRCGAGRRSCYVATVIPGRF